MKTRRHLCPLLLLVLMSQLQWRSEALIIPDEVPTLLSLIYSNIPTLKKGTDSRLGWGFRLGDRADFQVLLELGPQKETQPLANQGDSANKRAAAHTLANALYAQSLRNKQQERKQQKQEQTISNTKGGEFIKQWADDFKQPSVAVKPQPVRTRTPSTQAPTKFTLGIGEVDAKDFIPEDADVKGQTTRQEQATSALEMLTQMYNKKATVKPPRATTSWKDALDNVDLE